MVQLTALYYVWETGEVTYSGQSSLDLILALRTLVAGVTVLGLPFSHTYTPVAEARSACFRDFGYAPIRANTRLSEQSHRARPHPLRTNRYLFLDVEFRLALPNPPP